MTRMFFYPRNPWHPWVTCLRSGRAGRYCQVVKELAGEFEVMDTFIAEPPDATDPAITSRFQVGHHWRGGR